jgi:hypothetical protein
MLLNWLQPGFLKINFQGNFFETNQQFLRTTTLCSEVGLVTCVATRIDTKRHSKIARYGKSCEDNQLQKDTGIRSINDSPSLAFVTFVVAGREGVVAGFRSYINKSRSNMDPH